VEFHSKAILFFASCNEYTFSTKHWTHSFWEQDFSKTPSQFAPKIFRWDPFQLPTGYHASLTLTCKHHAYDPICSVNNQTDLERSIQTIDDAVDTESGVYKWYPMTVDSRYSMANGLVVILSVENSSTILDRIIIDFEYTNECV